MAIMKFIVVFILSLATAAAAVPVRDQKNNRGAVDKHFLGGMGYPGMGMGYPGMGMGYPGMGMGYPGMGMGYPGMGMGYPGFGGFHGGYPGYMGGGYPMGGYPGGGFVFYNKDKGGNKTPSIRKP